MNLNLIRNGKIWYYKDSIIVTDTSNSKRKDAVFPLCYENMYFLENLAVNEGDVVLDLGTGSGILAIHSAEKAQKVYATDINKRALEFAKLNLKLNNVNNVELIEGNLFDPIRSNNFNLIISNPPFEPDQNNMNYIHSAGGNKGTQILEKILKEIEEFILPNGSFQVITWIPESRLNILSLINKTHYNRFTIDKLKQYARRDVREYLQKKNIVFNEPVSLYFIQALNKKGQ